VTSDAERASSRAPAHLFREDAGVHDPYADTSWPTRAGLAHYTALTTDAACLLLLARDGDAVVGYLVGKLSEPSPTTRQPVRFAVLESIHVDADRRGAGFGGALTRTSWAGRGSSERWPPT
jgi:ribosomal protein S18 acetylase RimI-like enzyme